MGNVRGFAVALVLLLSSAYGGAGTVFEEAFDKTAVGPFSVTRTFSATGGPATISLVLEIVDGVAVRHGGIELNGQALFGSLDFKVVGILTKPVSLVSGTNTLVVTLGGGAGGRAGVRVATDEPALVFEPGTVFVSATTGQDGAECGARQAPCATIREGLLRAEVAPAPAVAVAMGIYTESLSLVNGVSLDGGYDPEFTRRDIVSLRALVRGDDSSEATVTASGVDRPTRLEGFVLLGPTSRVPSRNSVGLSIRGCNESLVVRNNVILAGVAGRGANGGAGIDGVSGLPGGSGRSSALYTAPMSNPGGDGGAGTPFLGGKGGGAVAPLYGQRQESGSDGLGAGPGQGGPGGSDAQWAGTSCVALWPPSGALDGLGGTAGAHGGDGSGGSGGQGGVLTAEGWLAAPGSPGQPGNAGSGGGGGGGGGGVAADPAHVCASVPLIGPSGGGGGAGGTGGSGGAGGLGGGSAIGALIVTEAGNSGWPVFVSNQVYLGVAGDGGDGGRGGRAGEGGSGGSAGAKTTPVVGLAGAGGDGGSGGHGAGGGGGAGGRSIGILVVSSGADYAPVNEIRAETGRAGTGGRGGLSLGTYGSEGLEGEVIAVLTVEP